MTTNALMELADRLEREADNSDRAGVPVVGELMREAATQLRTAASDGAAPSIGEWSALHCLWQAMVDAGGATTVARHGVGNMADRWTVDVTAGMLAIERHFYPERFGGADNTHPPEVARDATNPTEISSKLVDKKWPARFGCNGPEGSFWTDDAELAHRLIVGTFDRDEWTVTDTEHPYHTAISGSAGVG